VTDFAPEKVYLHPWVELFDSAEPGASGWKRLGRKGENNMKKLLPGAVGLVVLGLAAPAAAADLPARTYTKAPPYVAATVYDWSGFYIGANGGYGWSRDCRRNVSIGLDLGCYNATGGVVGGQVGYRWQSAGWVFGLEAQGDWADLKGSTVNLNPAATEPLGLIGSRMDAFGLFTGQVGYAWNSALLYVKGGAAVTDRRFDYIAPVTGLVSVSTGYTTHWGGTVGAGVEYGFAPNWSAAIEYDHIFEDRQGVVFTGPAGGVLAGSRTSGGDTDLVTGRINFRFGGPVVAKY
jgi:outer membrane immunogenic protein